MGWVRCGAFTQVLKPPFAPLGPAWRSRPRRACPCAKPPRCAAATAPAPRRWSVRATWSPRPLPRASMPRCASSGRAAAPGRRATPGPSSAWPAATTRCASAPSGCCRAQRRWPPAPDGDRAHREESRPARRPRACRLIRLTTTAAQRTRAGRADAAPPRLYAPCGYSSPRQPVRCGSRPARPQPYSPGTPGRRHHPPAPAHPPAVRVRPGG